MSLSAFQRVLARMVADPDFRRRVAAEPATLLDGAGLSDRERRRIEAFSRDPGMRVNTVLYRANRLAPIHNALPRTCRALGPQLGEVLQTFWSSSELEDLQFPHEVARFVAFLERTASAHIATVRGLASLIKAEVAIFELLMLPRERMRARNRRARGAPHPLVRVVEVDVHPLDLAEVLDGTRELARCDEGRGGLLIDHRDDPGRVVALTERELASFRDAGKLEATGPTVAELRKSAIAWVRRYAADWQAAFAAASAAVQQETRDCLRELPPGSRVTVFIKADGVHPVAASAVIVTKNAIEDGLEVEVVDADETFQATSMLGATQALEYVDAAWRTMIRNWWPGRHADAIELFQTPATRVNDDAYLRYVPAALGDVGYAATLARTFRSPIQATIPAIVPTPPVVVLTPPAVVPTPPAPPVFQHVHSAKQDREVLAVRRWMQVHIDELVYAIGLEDPFWSRLGLSSPAWFLLNARRADVFGTDPDGDGDIDLVAGPLRFDIDEKEWRDRIDAAQATLPLHLSRGHAADSARDQACIERRIVWPPKMDTIVACEVKASWFDAAAAEWKTTHVSSQHKVIKQLSRPLNEGVDRVAFLHLAATRPAARGNQPWIEAAFDAHAATEAWRAAPKAYELFTSADLPDCGYLRAVTGAVAHAPEDQAGAGGRLETVITVPLNPRRNPEAPWRTALQAKLATCRPPTHEQVFINACPRCNAWMLSGLPDRTCECSPSRR